MPLAQNRRTLLGLPTEIHEEIIKNLHRINDFISRSNLRLTCSYFHDLIKPPTHADLLQVERSAFGRKRELYSCSDCILLLPKSQFADKMRKGRTGKGGGHPEDRACVECRLRAGKCTKWSIIVIMRERRMLCKKCGLRLPECSGETEDYCRACWRTQIDASGERPQTLARRLGEVAMREQLAREMTARQIREKMVEETWG